MTTVVDCAVCGGSGLMLARDPHVMPVDGSQDPWEMTECVLCDGTGVLQATDVAP